MYCTKKLFLTIEIFSAMVEAVRGLEGHHCVVPKYFDDDSKVLTRILNEVQDCDKNCEIGKCGKCGQNGFCCKADIKGNCPGAFSDRA